MHYIYEDEIQFLTVIQLSSNINMTIIVLGYQKLKISNFELPPKPVVGFMNVFRVLFCRIISL